MTPGVKPLIAGNWKMNGTSAMLGDLESVAKAAGDQACHVALCVPATLVARAAQAAARSALMIGGQDCHPAASGAHTGDISADMLKDAGAGAVIVGHSERRADHHESDATVRAKAEAAMAAGLTAIICVGETREQREAGKAGDIVARQLAESVPDTATAQTVVIAYEPVWAIGTGLTPTNEDIAAIHLLVREALSARFKDGAAFRILYGGSMKPGNAAEILAVANVDGGLIGGASLKSSDFLAICGAAGQ